MLSLVFYFPRSDYHTVPQAQPEHRRAAGLAGHAVLSAAPALHRAQAVEAHGRPRRARAQHLRDPDGPGQRRLPQGKLPHLRAHPRADAGLLSVVSLFMSVYNVLFLFVMKNKVSNEEDSL